MALNLERINNQTYFGTAPTNNVLTPLVPWGIPLFTLRSLINWYPKEPRSPTPIAKARSVRQAGQAL